MKTLQEKGKQPAEVAKLMGRDLSNVYRHFQRNRDGGAAPNPVGRPPALTAVQVDRVVDATDRMVVAADGKYQVTAKMVRDAQTSVLRQGVHVAALIPIALVRGCSALLLRSAIYQSARERGASSRSPIVTSRPMRLVFFGVRRAPPGPRSGICA